MHGTLQFELNNNSGEKGYGHSMLASMIPSPINYQHYSDSLRKIQLFFVMCLLHVETKYKSPAKDIIFAGLITDYYSLITAH